MNIVSKHIIRLTQALLSAKHINSAVSTKGQYLVAR